MQRASETRIEDRKIEAKTFEYPVEVTLTDRELLALGDETATLDADKQAIEDRHVTEKATYKKDIARVDGRASEVIQRLRTKKETRPMLCWNDFDYEAGICTIRRADSDETVKSRRMNPDEFKRPLPFNTVKKLEAVSDSEDDA